MEYEILPGEKLEPLFETQEDYEQFCKEYQELVKAPLDELAMKRALSERDVASKIL
jgi:hypothetical protein